MLYLFSLLVISVYSHSWLHCVDYNPNAPLKVGSIDNKQCNIFPRGVSSSTVFASDIGLDYNPTEDKPCKVGPSQSVQYTAGKTYRLLWPAKNHKADTCTNQFIPDTQLKVFFYPGTADPTLSTWTKAQYLVKDFKTGAGFQNCPDFCTDTDKAPCFGDMTIPSLPDGTYKGLWFWEFNPGQFFSHCFDVQIGSSSSSPPSTSSSPPSTSSAPPSTSSSAPPSTSSCVAQFDQCGGQNYKGLTNCCTVLKCVKSDNFYSQCLKPAGAVCADRFNQCGGEGYKGATNCCSGQCVKKDQFYSQCI
jgi:hypothetical protein